MSPTAWIIFTSVMVGIIFFNFFFFGNKGGKKQKDLIPAIEVKKEPWQKRSLFNGFVYYVLPPLLWAIGTIVLVNFFA